MPSIKPVAGTTRTDIAQDVAQQRGRGGDIDRARDEMLCELRARVLAAKDVGEELPKVAREMHEGKIQKEAVRGKCSTLQAIELASEGIELIDVPDELLKPIN